MAGIAHLGVGLAAKRLAPQAPVWTLLVASEAIDLLWGSFALAGLENFGVAPWSHSLLMAALWSLLAGLLSARLLKNRRAGLVIGGVVFSHWLLDFISHPMFGGPLDLPLLFGDSPLVGLGLYSRLPMGWVIIIEFACVASGLWVYWRTRQPARPQPGTQAAQLKEGNA